MASTLSRPQCVKVDHCSHLSVYHSQSVPTLCFIASMSHAFAVQLQVICKDILHVGVTSEWCWKFASIDCGGHSSGMLSPNSEDVCNFVMTMICIKRIDIYKKDGLSHNSTQYDTVLHTLKSSNPQNLQCVPQPCYTGNLHCVCCGNA